MKLKRRSDFDDDPEAERVERKGWRVKGLMGVVEKWDRAKELRNEPGVVKGTDFVGVKRNVVSFLVTVIGAIGSDEDCSLKRDQNRENQSQPAPSHCSWSALTIRSDRRTEKQIRTTSKQFIHYDFHANYHIYFKKYKTKRCLYFFFFFFPL